MRYSFSQEQVQLLKTFSFEFDVTGDLTDEQALAVEDAVSECFSMHGLADNGDMTNEIGEICGDIMNELARE